MSGKRFAIGALTAASGADELADEPPALFELARDDEDIDDESAAAGAGDCANMI